VLNYFRINDTAPSVPLSNLDGTATTLDYFSKNATNEGKPLVIFAGSWT